MMIRIPQWCLLAVLLIVGLAGSPCALAESEEWTEWNIFGGSEAPAGKYNYVIKLTSSSGDTKCAGIALASQWVLTAEHCVPNVTRALPFGATEGRLIGNRYCYSRYKGSTGTANTQNDLALLKISPESSAFDVWWKLGVESPNASNLVVFGWGKTSSGGSFSPKLLKSKAMSRQDTGKCNTAWSPKGQIVDGNEVCAGASVSSACNGDSGGPLFNTDSASEPQRLVGILSKADNVCDAAGIYDIYTKVDADWVGKIINNTGDARSRSLCL